MNELSAFGPVTIGQYLPRDSVVHRLDPRAKILMFLLLVAAVVLANSYVACLILLAVVLGIVCISQVPVRFALRGLRPALPWIALFAMLQLLFYKGSYAAAECLEIWSWGFIDITSCSVRLVSVMVLRLLSLMLLTSLLTLTTSTTELTHGLDRLLSPLKCLRFPAHELAMVFTIALRFAPTLADELEKIMKAQASRGADFGEQGRLRFVQRTLNLLPLMVPLFLSALRRAEDLTLAMEARGYTGGKGRTSFIQLKSRPRDYCALALVGLFCAFLLICDFTALDGGLVSTIVASVQGILSRVVG